MKLPEAYQDAVDALTCTLMALAATGGGARRVLLEVDPATTAYIEDLGPWDPRAITSGDPWTEVSVQLRAFG
jgi:hypothetical protein